ncbi:hypothetical protein SAMN05444141_105243 [Pseudovibrio denitrificans]|uniref:Uncharacterized protein n=1 Tax=Pseudovibrio denitrificans TaxID=258256 RepID=A0A1I7C6J9_9HYPH|nr:hypothetical protein [Pseudovibrio denitrificans]SFT95035.1 hypothetical protein SAMN05444141_105243 [Pseudovibrio denitrificans]
MIDPASFPLTKALSSPNASQQVVAKAQPADASETRSFIELANTEMERFYTKGAPIKLSESSASVEMIDVQRLLLQTQEIWQKHFR